MTNVLVLQSVGLVHALVDSNVTDRLTIPTKGINQHFNLIASITR